MSSTGSRVLQCEVRSLTVSRCKSFKRIRPDVYWFAPLCDLREQRLTPGFLQQIARRIWIFLDAYGFSQQDDLFNWIQLRLKTEIGLFESGVTDDPVRRQKKLEAGHLALYKRDLDLITNVSELLRKLI